MPKKKTKQQKVAVNITKYDCVLSPFDWYVQFQIRRELIGYLHIREENGDGSKPLDARVQRLLKSISADPIVELHNLGKCGFYLCEFSLRMLYFIAEGCAPPVFVIRNRDFPYLLDAFDGRCAMLDSTTLELPQGLDWMVSATVKFAVDPEIYQSGADSSAAIERLNSPVNFHGNMRLLAFDPDHSNQVLRHWAGKCLDNFENPDGEKTRRPRENFASAKGDRRKSSLDEAWRDYKTLADMDIQIQAKAYNLDLEWKDIATLLHIGRTPAATDKVRKTIRSHSRKIFNPDSRVSNELELLAREDLLRRSNANVKSEKDKAMLKWTSQQIKEYGLDGQWADGQLTTRPRTGEGIFESN